jgi:pimeloyl-ACP methyl ester carboxylesterase
VLNRTNIDGVELEYQVSGNGEPVVFIHGAFIADAFKPLLNEPALSDKYQLILYHRRGYAGSSRASGIVSISQQAADCRALLRHLGIDRAHIVGHSYGGAVALQLALDTPAIVRSLTLLEPALMVGASAQDYRDSLLRGIDRYRVAGAATVVDEFLQARSPGYRPVLDRELPGAFVQAVADAGTTFDHELPGLLEWQFDEARAAQVSHPTLSVLGGRSEALSPRFGEAHRLLLEWLPHIDGVVLPGATHLMLTEDPQGVAEILADHWGRHRITAEDS